MHGLPSWARLTIRASAIFGLISFCWSFSGYFSPFPSRFGEYTSSAIFNEVGAHIVFGLAAGAFSLDLGLALTCGAASILIDLDHVLPALGLPVLARTAHSMVFAFVSALVIALLSKSVWKRGTLFATLFASVLAHMSYDVFAGDGLFPLFAPVSFGFFVFPPWTWLPLEVGAAMLVFAVTVAARVAHSRAASLL